MSLWCEWGIIFICTFISRWIPVLALYILKRRELSPSFLCRCNSSSTLFCLNCNSQLSSVKLGSQLIFFFLSVIGVRNLLGFEKVVFLFFLLFLFLVSVVDFWSQLIPNSITVSGVFLFLFFRILIHQHSISSYIFSFFITLLTLFVFCWATKGMGGGDAKFLAVNALVLGWSDTLLAFWLSILSALIYIVFRFFFYSIIQKGPLAFGPHLSIGCYIAYVWGKEITDWYLSLFHPF